MIVGVMVILVALAALGTYAVFNWGEYIVGAIIVAVMATFFYFAARDIVDFLDASDHRSK